MGLSTVEIRVPNTQQSSNNRDVFLERSLPKVLIHCVRTSQEILEILEPNMNSDAETDSAPNTIASTNPALETKHVLRIDAEFCDLGFVGGESNEMLGDITLAVCFLEEPFLGRVGIRACLCRSEGLGGDEEEGRFWVGVTEGFG